MRGDGAGSLSSPWLTPAEPRVRYAGDSCDQCHDGAHLECTGWTDFCGCTCGLPTITEGTTMTEPDSLDQDLAHCDEDDQDLTTVTGSVADAPADLGRPADDSEEQL